MFGRAAVNTEIGILTRGWGKWRGCVPVAGFEPLNLIIVIGRQESLDPFVHAAAVFSDNFLKLKEEFANELFEAYAFYKRTDIEEGGFTEVDFAEYPRVETAGEIWNALRPYELRLGPTIDKYVGNSYLLMSVAWPNPHFFQFFMQYSDGWFRAMHTELVG